MNKNKKKLKKYKLKNLIVDWISVVDGKASPRNPAAEMLIVKANKKEENEMEKSKLLSFLYGLIGKATEEEDVEKAGESQEETKVKTPDYVTKADFEAFKEEMKSIFLEKASDSKEDNQLNAEFFKSFAEAYKSDIADIKKSMIIKTRETAPVNEQPDLQDLFMEQQKKANKNSPAADGQVVNRFVQEKIDKGILKAEDFPCSESDFDLAIKAICQI